MGSESLLLALRLGAATLTGAALAPGASDCDDLRGGAILPAVDWQLEIKPLFNELLSPIGRCTSCHNPAAPAGGLDLTDVGFDAIYKLINSFVIPGSPETSSLFLKINCDRPPVGERMPLGGAPLSLEEQALVHDWIEQGARGEPLEEPIFRDFLFRDGAEARRW